MSTTTNFSAAVDEVMQRPAIVVSHDHPVASTLCELLAIDHDTVAKLAPTFQDAERLLASTVPQSVFLDLRPHAGQQNPTSLLRRLADAPAPHVPVIAIGGEGYVCEWASLADSTVQAHLSLPIDRRQLSRLLMGDVAPNTYGPAGDLPRVVQSETIRCQTSTPAMIQVLDDLSHMAPHNVTILLVGETGTGKTTLARLVHELSARRNERFLTVACGALPPDLIESELFGHVKGSFTGADRTKIGKFEAAAGGTLLLDEIDVLGSGEQAKLLRIIETGEFESVGSNDTRQSSARLIAASNVDLADLMDREEFRADLYYRLNVLQFRVPPLRERTADIVPLTLDFVEEFCRDYQLSIRRIHPEFLRGIKRYSWPGNIRELKNHVRRAVLFCRQGELTLHDLPEAIRLAAERPNLATENCGNLPQTLSQRVATDEQRILEQALKENGYHRTATARALGISRVGLYKKMKRYGLLDAGRGSSGTSLGQKREN
jgi:DNA-binding NtrC family response regulator